jgi:hypothetical protein
MPSSAVLNFADPYAYQKAVHAADLQVFVAARGTFEATLTRIKLDRLWMQRARFSLPAVTHSAVGKDRSMIFLQFDLDQAPILHSGIEVPPDQIVLLLARVGASLPHIGELSLRRDVAEAG